MRLDAMRLNAMRLDAMRLDAMDFDAMDFDAMNFGRLFPGHTGKHFKKVFKFGSSSVRENDTSWYNQSSIMRANMHYPDLFMTLIAVQPLSQNAALIQALRGNNPGRDAAELQEMFKHMFCHGNSISPTTMRGFNTYSLISAWTPQFKAFK